MISKNQIKFIKSLELKKNRKREGLFVAEGPKVVGDLLRAGFLPHSIYNTAELPKILQSGIDVKNILQATQPITEEELHKISFLQHPQQVLAIFQIPSENTPSKSAFSTQKSSFSDHLSLALDGVQDPGNVGTIIRIADWFGIETIYCSLDTADV